MKLLLFLIRLVQSFWFQKTKYLLAGLLLYRDGVSVWFPGWFFSSGSSRRGSSVLHSVVTEQWSSSVALQEIFPFSPFSTRPTDLTVRIPPCRVCFPSLEGSFIFCRGPVRARPGLCALRFCLRLCRSQAEVRRSLVEPLSDETKWEKLFQA